MFTILTFLFQCCGAIVFWNLKLVDRVSDVHVCGSSNHFCSIFAEANKQLSYRRETALQGGLVMAKSGRLKLGDILQTYKVYLTPLLISSNKSKSNRIRSKMKNKGYYAVQGHSRLSRSVPIESPYATSY